jgi:hypothetical protein
MDFLIAQGISTAQNGLIHTLAIWLDDHIKGDFVRERKEKAVHRFYRSITDNLRERKYQRIKWDKKRRLPPSYKNNSKAIDEIANKVLYQIKEMSFEQGLAVIGELYAAWILTCPEFMIRNSSQYKELISSGTEAELIDLMLQYLDMYD